MIIKGNKKSITLHYKVKKKETIAPTWHTEQNIKIKNKILINRKRLIN